MNLLLLLNMFFSFLSHLSHSLVYDFVIVPVILLFLVMTTMVQVCLKLSIA
jgi:hypothetical protein